MTLASAETRPADRAAPPTHHVQLNRKWMWLAVFIAELGLTFLIVDEPTWLGGALLAHAVVFAALWLALGVRSRRDGCTPPPVDSFLLVVTGFLGPVGVLGALLTMGILRHFAGQTTPFNVWYQAIFADTESATAIALQRRVVLEHDSGAAYSSVAPFSDMMASGSIEQKQAVLRLINDKFRPEFAPALLAAMNDAEPTVRVMSATAAARVESHFFIASMSLEDRHARNPEDILASAELARHYDDYANCGVLDAGRVLTARVRALELYRDCARLGGVDVAMMNATIRLLVRLGREREAVESFGPLVGGGTAAPELLVWYVECLYRMRNFTAVRQICRSLDIPTNGRIRVTERWQQAAALWAKGEPAPGNGSR